MIRFGYPHLLWLLLLVPIWTGLFFWAFRRRRLAATAFISPSLLDRIAYSLSRRRVSWKAVLWLAAWLFLLLGAADPQVGTKLEEVKR